ncbi:transcriptional regulator Spx [Enterococcus hulanensis]|uniref:Transcriptional regulator Spx n=1 Tax=Enterococcus hulanensis TaxID=2559929 RepID=A0ABU3EVT8_9ENTE|nr:MULTISPECIES: transcriptional regulator Spx [Enterococcus]MBO0411016.1 transcriptional regulator Spx [Enterococcus hulanensis]MBO0458032.1 transcriptional regulator Spx [Enterococcus hulanensis]MBX8937612.1 transcriptional regulator Spx [Enterococcus gilvus]MDT2598964.1 transcriptional regulator Spx [Enterococcus hulanensis]MDT2610615.1 transcriptional regulator Spx [Enterococcus hulanensis]
MIKLYGSASCNSCRKAKAWLEEQSLDFEERNIITDPLTKRELKEILSLTENGTEDIIATRSKVYQKFDFDLNDLSFNELVGIIEENPGLLKRPIVIDETKLQIGFNEDEIHQFIPREVRKLNSKKMTETLFYMDWEKQKFA